MLTAMSYFSGALVPERNASGAPKAEPMPQKTVIIRIKRQLNPAAAAAWEEFELPWKRGMNVISSLMDIALNPVSRGISCTCCMEVCPQFNSKTGFVGAATIGQVRLFNSHPTGAMQKEDRLHALMGDGGIHECGYAQNCVEICPKDIPLTRAIAEVGRAVIGQAVVDFFKR